VHELSLCDSIARAVADHAGGKRVASVQLRIGALRQVVPETLSYCWSVVGRGPQLDGSVLSIEVVPGQVECADCGGRTILDRFCVSCAGCGSTATRVVAGEELLIMSIDVAEPEHPTVTAS
jgi:hydrogenase nickel incorporation protein HypA/HybF